jgi:hypothetical protein
MAPATIRSIRMGTPPARGKSPIHSGAPLLPVFTHSSSSRVGRRQPPITKTRQPFQKIGEGMCFDTTTYDGPAGDAVSCGVRMSLIPIVSLIVIGALAVLGLLGYLIDRSADRHEGP